MDVSNLKQKEVNAEWFDSDYFPNVKWHIAPAQNMEYRNKLNRLAKPERRKIDKGTLKPEKQDEITCKALAGTVLLGWEGIEEDGQPVEFSEKKAIEFLRNKKVFQEVETLSKENDDSGNFEVPEELNDRLSELVAEFYQKDYWNDLLLRKVKSQDIAVKVFEMAVNIGKSKALSYAQESVNLVLQEEFNIKVDGLSGPQTIRALNYVSQSEETEFFLKMVKTFQGINYINIARKNPEQKLFLKGWFNRLEA